MLLNNLDDQIWAKLQKDLQSLLPENSVASFTNLIHRKKVITRPQPSRHMLAEMEYVKVQGFHPVSFFLNLQEITVVQLKLSLIDLSLKKYNCLKMNLAKKHCSPSSGFQVTLTMT